MMHTVKSLGENKIKYQNLQDLSTSFDGNRHKEGRRIKFKTGLLKREFLL